MRKRFELFALERVIIDLLVLGNLAFWDAFRFTVVTGFCIWLSFEAGNGWTIQKASVVIKVKFYIWCKKYSYLPNRIDVQKNLFIWNKSFL